MGDYKRRDDGSTFDAEQPRDKQGRFKAEKREPRVLPDEDKQQPGESFESHLERMAIEASKSIQQMLSEFEEKPFSLD